MTEEKYEMTEEGDKMTVSPEHIICGNGASEFISLVSKPNKFMLHSKSRL